MEKLKKYKNRIEERGEKNRLAKERRLTVEAKSAEVVRMLREAYGEVVKAVSQTTTGSMNAQPCTWGGSTTNYS